MGKLSLGSASEILLYCRDCLENDVPTRFKKRRLGSLQAGFCLVGEYDRQPCIHANIAPER